MAYYAALISVVQLLKEINHPQLPHPNSHLPEKHQIHASLYEKINLMQEFHAPLYEKFNLLQELLEDYSPKDHKDESADILEGRIRDAAYRAQNIIESPISNKIPRRNRKDGQDMILVQKVMEEVELIVEELRRIKLESHDAHGNVQQKKTNISEDCGQPIHGDNLQGTNFSASSTGASTQAPKMNVGGASKVKDLSGRSTTVVLDEDLITTIKSQICGEPSSRVVISIVGMGGLGKTTLARNIFDDKLIHYRFDCRAWVTASQDYQQRNILLAIVDSLNMERKEELKTAEVGVLREQIYKHLKGKRYIIVIDDVWDTKVWDDVKMVFPNDNNGSRVITTTRLLDVAVYAHKSGFIHQLQFLNEDQSWNLFHQKVFCPTELEDIGRLIAKNCRGLPLAIVVVAGLLSKVNKTRCDWKEIARDVSSAAIGQNDEQLSKILSLSYNHLPHHLKPCFLYLGGFPEDYDIRVSELIWLWIAEGLLQPIADKSLEEVGEEYLKDLVKRNLVSIIEKKSCGKIKKCGIHDLLRDLCLQRAYSERFSHCLHKEEDFNRESVGDVHRFSIHMWRGSLSHIFKRKYISHARSILCFPEDCDLLDLFSIASSFKHLRVLDTRLIHGSLFTEVVGKILYLRYLALREYRIFPSSSMFKLQNLQTLIVGDYSSLPSEIWEMPQLRHVKGEGLKFPPIPYDEIRIINGVPLLGNLQTLQTTLGFRFTRDTVEMIPILKKLKVQYFDDESDGTWEEFQLNNLVHLRQLEILSIWFFHHIDPLPQNFAFPSTLIKLTLLGCYLPWKDMRVVGSLPKLQVLKLEKDAFGHFAGKEWVPAEGEFPKLKSLRMSELRYLKYWRAEDIHFPCLEKLHIRSCPHLLEIPLEIGDISTLQCIVVERCNSTLDSSALKIQEEQQDLGNYHLHVRVVPARR